MGGAVVVDTALLLQVTGGHFLAPSLAGSRQVDVQLGGQIPRPGWRVAGRSPGQASVHACRECPEYVVVMPTVAIQGWLDGWMTSMHACRCRLLMHTHMLNTGCSR